MEQKSLRNTATDYELLDMLVANISYQLMQIIVYLPSSYWIQLLVLTRATCSNGLKCILLKDLEQWCSQTLLLGCSKTRMPRFALEFKEIFIK